MERLNKHKWIIFLIMIIVVVIFDTIVYNVAIDDRGIVVGIGVDKDGGEYAVTTQIVLQKNGGISGGGSNFVTLTEKAKTIQSAFDIISSKLGMPVSVAHAVVIVFGRALLVDGEFALIRGFLVNDNVSDAISLVMTDGAPKDILSAKVPYGDNASFQIQRALVSSNTPIGRVNITLKDYAVDYYSPQASCYMPIVDIEKTPPNTDQGKAGEKEADQLVINRTAIINKEGYVCALSKESNEGLSLVKKTIRGGTVIIDGDDKNKVSINIIESKTHMEYDLERMTATVKVDCKTVRAAGRFDESGNIAYVMSTDEKMRFEQAIREKITSAYDTAKTNDADILQVYQGFYRKYGKAWTAKVKDKYLGQITLKVSTKISER